MSKSGNRTMMMIFSFIISISGIISLIVDEIFVPFLEAKPEVKLIIILISVLTAYHGFSMISMKTIIKEQIEITNNNISDIKTKVQMFDEAIPFSYLDDVERQHGKDNKNIPCEMWVIANTLQEAENSKTKESNCIIATIFDNITRNNVHYYYVLPDCEKSKQEIASLQTKMQEMLQKSRRRVTGGISYKLDETLDKIIASDYFDIVLFIDCDSRGNPRLMDGKSEGYQCYSVLNADDKYYYQPINEEKVRQIRLFYKSKDFIEMNI